MAVVNDKAGVSLDLLQFKVAAGMGIVHQVHRGSSPEGVRLYAGVWGRQHDRNDDVQVRSASLDARETSGHARGDADKTDFTRLLMLFSYKNKHGLKVEAAFVKRYTHRQKAGEKGSKP
ncbi:TPA: hypothetical protein ACH3X2_000315 [Trebouxia sp. C0005]